MAQDIANKDDFDIDKKDAYKYEVLGGTHLMLATKKLNKEHPESIYFRGRSARIYCGLTSVSELINSNQQLSNFVQTVSPSLFKAANQ